jgi:hypothetical protein
MGDKNPKKAPKKKGASDKPSAQSSVASTSNSAKKPKK